MAKRNHIGDNWLLDAEVRTKIKKIKGRWEVSLMFIDTIDPNQFLIQVIGDYRSQKLAEIYAENIKRTVIKGEKRTKKINASAYNFSKN